MNQQGADSPTNDHEFRRRPTVVRPVTSDLVS